MQLTLPVRYFRDGGYSRITVSSLRGESDIFRITFRFFSKSAIFFPKKM
jgi:hypothetical protein